MRRPRSITEVGLVLFATVHIQTHTVYTQQHLEQWALEAAPEEVVTFLVLPHYTSARGKKLQFPEARLSRFSQVKKKKGGCMEKMLEMEWIDRRVQRRSMDTVVPKLFYLLDWMIDLL